jgi:hypothetical protein
MAATAGQQALHQTEPQVRSLVVVVALLKQAQRQAQAATGEWLSEVISNGKIRNFSWWQSSKHRQG